LNTPDGFPADNWMYGGGISAIGAYINGWTVSGSGIADTCNTPCTFTSLLGGGTTVGSLVGQFVFIGGEIMQITSATGGTVGLGPPTTATITATRALAGGVQLTIPSGTGITGLIGYMIDGNTPCQTEVPLGNTLYLDPLVDNTGWPQGTEVGTQINYTNACGIIGVTQAGWKFNSPQSGPFNPLVASQVSLPGPSISNTSTFKYFGANVNSKWATVLTNQLVGLPENQGTVIHFKGLINVTNSTGGAVAVFGSLNFTDYNGSRAFSDSAGNGLSIPGSSLNQSQIQFEGTAVISFVTINQNATPTISVDGTWKYSTTVIASGTSTTAQFPMVYPQGTPGSYSSLTNTFGPDYLNPGGLTIDAGVRFASASTGLTATLANFETWVETPTQSTQR
jgi:hypothetical protein